MSAPSQQQLFDQQQNRGPGLGSAVAKMIFKALVGLVIVVFAVFYLDRRKRVEDPEAQPRRVLAWASWVAVIVASAALTFPWLVSLATLTNLAPRVMFGAVAVAVAFTGTAFLEWVTARRFAAAIGVGASMRVLHAQTAVATPYRAVVVVATLVAAAAVVFSPAGWVTAVVGLWLLPTAAVVRLVSAARAGRRLGTEVRAANARLQEEHAGYVALFAALFGVAPSSIEEELDFTPAEDGDGVVVHVPVKYRLKLDRGALNEALAKLGEPVEVVDVTPDGVLLVPLTDEEEARRAAAHESGGLILGFEEMGEEVVGSDSEVGSSFTAFGGNPFAAGATGEPEPNPFDAPIPEPAGYPCRGSGYVTAPDAAGYHPLDDLFGND